jgi:hypothetical protein
MIQIRRLLSPLKDITKPGGIINERDTNISDLEFRR